MSMLALIFEQSFRSINPLTVCSNIPTPLLSCLQRPAIRFAGPCCPLSAIRRASRYFTSTLAPLSSSFFFIVSDSSFETRSEEHTSELQSRLHLVCRLLLEKKKNNTRYIHTA